MGKSNNFLDMIPYRKDHVQWTTDEKNLICIFFYRNSFISRCLRFIFNTPEKISIDLDEIGSAVWGMCDGKSSILDIGKKLLRKFGDKTEPLYPRLAHFIKILYSQGYIGLQYNNREEQHNEQKSGQPDRFLEE